LKNPSFGVFLDYFFSFTSMLVDVFHILHKTLLYNIFICNQVVQILSCQLGNFHSKVSHIFFFNSSFKSFVFCSISTCVAETLLTKIDEFFESGAFLIRRVQSKVSPLSRSEKHFSLGSSIHFLCNISSWSIFLLKKARMDDGIHVNIQYKFIIFHSIWVAWRVYILHHLGIFVSQPSIQLRHPIAITLRRKSS